MAQAGPLALIGGSEWQPGCDFDAGLLASSGTGKVVVLPTAAAFENPDQVLDKAVRWFSGFDAEVVALRVLSRSDAQDASNAAVVREAAFVYLADGSALHLRSVLKHSAVFEALVEAWRNGAVVAGSAAGATVLGDPMVDPRGGTFTLGLGMFHNMAFVPHWDKWSDLRARRMGHLSPKGVPIVELQERTALIRGVDGGWTVSGAGRAALRLDNEPVDVSRLRDLVEI